MGSKGMGISRRVDTYSMEYPVAKLETGVKEQQSERSIVPGIITVLTYGVP